MTIGGARLTRRALAPAALVLALVVALSVDAVVRATGHPPTRCDRFALVSAERLGHDQAGVEANGPRVVVIGDSYSVGLGLDHPLESWPSRLPGRVHVAGFSGSGFAATPCGHTSYADRAGEAVRDGADLVVVEGGLNDAGYSDEAITAGFDRLMGELGGLEVVVVGPPPAPKRGDLVLHVDRVLTELTATHGVGYVSMLEARLPYLDDLLHLTAAGHQEFGDAVVTGLGADPDTGLSGGLSTGAEAVAHAVG